MLHFLALLVLFGLLALDITIKLIDPEIQPPKRAEPAPIPTSPEPPAPSGDTAQRKVS